MYDENVVSETVPGGNCKPRNKNGLHTTLYSMIVYLKVSKDSTILFWKETKMLLKTFLILKTLHLRADIIYGVYNLQPFIGVTCVGWSCSLLACVKGQVRGPHFDNLDILETVVSVG